MTQEEISNFIRNKHPVTTSSIKITFKSGDFDFGFFTSNIENFNSENKWRYVPNNLSSKYQKNKSNENTKIIDGDEIISLILL